jgi:formylmethanofuran dehydrogenase subunit C
VSVEGNGQITINANCTGGTIAIRGNFDRTDLSGGAITFSDDARFTRSEVAAAVEAVLAAAHGSDSWETAAGVDIAAVVWDALQNDHKIANTMGAAMQRVIPSSTG